MDEKSEIQHQNSDEIWEYFKSYDHRNTHYKVHDGTVGAYGEFEVVAGASAMRPDVMIVLVAILFGEALFF